MSAEERVQQLQQEVHYYQNEQRSIVANVRGILQQAVQGHQGSLPEHIRHASIDQQIEALKLLAVTREYACLLSEVAEQVRAVERQIRGASHAEDAEALAQAAFATADSYAACKQQLEQLRAREFPAEAVPAQLRSTEADLSARLQSGRDSLRQLISSQVRSFLEQCGWPPPLTGASKGADAAAHFPGEPAGFSPESLFTPEHGELLSLLQRLLVALTVLQKVEDKEVLDKLAEGPEQLAVASSAPVLWIAEELAAPLSSKLLHYFSNEQPAGQLDKPEWLLNTVYRLCKENAPRLDFLQSVVQACDLHHSYNFSVEFSRALRNTVKQLLRQSKLPAVARAQDHALWLLYMDSLVAFETRMAPLLGLMMGPEAGALPAVLLKDSTLSVLGEDPSWMDAWLAAEAEAADKQVEGLLYSASGWDKAPSLVAEDRPPWQCELYPPAAAEQLVAMVEGLLERVRYIPQADAQDKYLQCVVGDVLRQAHGRILRMLQQADVFKDIAGLLWLPKVCVCICFCHFLEVHLEELHESLLLLLTSTQDATPNGTATSPTAAAVGAAAGHPPPSPTKQQQQHHGSPSKQHPHHHHGALSNGHSAASPAAAAGGGGGASSSSHGGGSSSSSSIKRRALLLSRPVEDFRSCRREWVLKVAKAVAQGFSNKAHAYMSRESIFKDGDLHDSGGGVVSGLLLDGLAWLQHVLAMLAEHLDATCFREGWRAIAASLNRDLFNNVASEMIFSPAGARQFSTDVGAVLRCFSPYTGKPQAHFRELLDALKLLGLPQDQASWVHQVVSPASRAPNALEVLKMVQVTHLDPDQADTVLSLRM